MLITHDLVEVAQKLASAHIEAARFEVGAREGARGTFVLFFTLSFLSITGALDSVITTPSSELHVSSPLRHQATCQRGHAWVDVLRQLATPPAYARGFE